MIKRKGFPKIFFGWWTATTAGLLMGLATAVYTYGFSVLFKPIASELGFSRAVTSVAGSIGQTEGGFAAPLFGWVTDRFGPKWIIVSGVFVFGLGLILMSFVNSLWTFYLVWGVIIATGAQVVQGIPGDTAIANWFVKKRGIAMGIKWVLSGLLIAPILPITAWLITMVGWQMTYVIFGLVMWFVALPLAWFFFKRHRPEYYGLLPDGAAVKEDTTGTGQMIEKGVGYAAEIQEIEFTLRQAVRTPSYWLLIIAQISQTGASSVFGMHLVPFLTDFGINPIRAAAMFSMMFLTSIPLRVVGGLLADRVRKEHLRFLIGGAYLVQAAGITLFLLNQTIPMTYTWIILWGIGYGVAMPLNTVIRGRYFGRKAIGSILGFSRMLMTPMAVAAPVYAGWIFDITGSYLTVFTLVAALLIFATVFMSLATPPKPPAEVTDIRKIV